MSDNKYNDIESGDNLKYTDESINVSNNPNNIKDINIAPILDSTIIQSPIPFYANIEFYISYLVMLVSIYFITDNFLLGIVSSIAVIAISYFGHIFTHKCCGTENHIFSYVHRYHHTHNDFLAYFSQPILELFSGFSIIVIQKLIGIPIFDVWTVIFYTLFYASVHSINYNIVPEKKIHLIHHKNTNVNFGPDIMDYIFGTKDLKNPEPENTIHHIPNIIVSAIVVYIIKYIYGINDNYKQIVTVAFLTLFVTFAVILLLSMYYIHLNIKSRKINLD